LGREKKFSDKEKPCSRSYEDVRSIGKKKKRNMDSAEDNTGSIQLTKKMALSYRKKI